MEEADDDFKSLCAGVGFVVIQWAQAEQVLDLIVATLFHGFKGKEVAEKNQLPRQLTRKVKFVRRCLQRIPSLSAYKDEGNALLNDFIAISQKRHDYVHGAITGTVQGNDGFGFIKLDAQGDFHVLTEFTFNPGDFPVLARKLLDLGAASNAFCRRLRDEIEQREQSQ